MKTVLLNKEQTPVFTPVHARFQTHTERLVDLLFFSTQLQEVVQISAGPVKKERVDKAVLGGAAYSW